MAFDDPDVVVPEFTPGSLPVLVASLGDQGFGRGELAAQFVEMGGVGGEVPAGHACVALVAGFQRWQQAHPVGQHPVGARGELGHFVDVMRGDVDVGAVRPDLLVFEELCFGSGREGGRVAGGHLGTLVAEVALHDVEGNAVVE